MSYKLIHRKTEWVAPLIAKPVITKLMNIPNVINVNTMYFGQSESVSEDE